MSSRRVQSSISGLERDITNYEAYLSKVVKGKVDKPKSSTYKSVQNVSPSGIRERSVMPFVTGPVKTSYPPKRKLNPQKVITKPSSTGNHVLCKEVFENNNATVEVTVKTRAPTNDRSRKRPRSNTLISIPETDKPMAKDEIQKQSNVSFEPPDLYKLNRNAQHDRKNYLHPKHKHLSWAHILKDKNTSCLIHNGRAKDTDEVGLQNSHTNSRRSIHSFKHEHKYSVTDDSLNSSISDDSSRMSDQEALRCINRSVQCCLPKSTSSGDKQKGMPSSNLPSKYNSNSGDCGGGTFSMFNPVRTLNFLVKELRGKLQKSEGDDNMQRIITDMEEALIRIPSEVNAQEMNHANDIPTRDETPSTRTCQSGFVPLKPAETFLSKPVLKPKTKFARQESEICFPQLREPYPEQQRNRMDLHSSKHKEPETPSVKETTSESQIAQRELELKCAKLELTSKQLELTCDQLRKERDYLNQQITSQKEESEVMTNKEKDYLTTISCLRSNLESMTKRSEEQAKEIAELATNCAQLKEENKVLLPLRDTETVLARRLKESNEEEERIHAELQIMKLEREKFEILMASKDKELDKFKQELRDIQALASEQLLNLKSFATSHNKPTDQIDKVTHDTGKQSFLNNDSDIDSLTTEIKLFLEKAQTGGGGETGKQPICSSPTSSVPSSLGIYPSWQKLSRISSSSRKRVNKVSSSEVLILSPAEKNGMKESGDDDTDVDDNNSFVFMKPKSPEFKSFLLASLSESVVAESRSESSTTQLKSCKELKDELRSLFDRIKEQTRMGTGISLPSPPRHYSEISEPGGMSQWSEFSDVESVQNSRFFSVSNTELDKGKFNFSVSEISNKNKLEADN